METSNQMAASQETIAVLTRTRDAQVTMAFGVSLQLHELLLEKKESSPQA
jgi:hypothetical protein